MTNLPIAMSALNVQVRHATQDDIPFVAWCNYEASSPEPGFCYWDPLLEGLNTDTMDFIKAVFQADAFAWGNAKNFFIAEIDGMPIGGATGFEMNSADYRPLNLERLQAVADILGWDQAALSIFREKYEAIWRDPLDVSIAPTTHWTIECVAVKPEYRGQGVAKALIRAVLAEGKQNGFSHGGISVTMGNEPAQRAYEGSGFQMNVTYGADYFDGAFPGTIKYRIAL